MMKIRAFYDSNLNLIKIPCLLKTSHKRIKTILVFDTGSPKTLISYTDSLRLNIPRGEKAELIKMGGKTYQAYESNKVSFVFKNISGVPVDLSFPVKVLKPTSSKMEHLEELDSFPNILGIDFLKKGYAFHCDLNNNEIYFEKI